MPGGSSFPPITGTHTMPYASSAPALASLAFSFACVLFFALACVAYLIHAGYNARSAARHGHTRPLRYGLRIATRYPSNATQCALYLCGGSSLLGGLCFLLAIPG